MMCVRASVCVHVVITSESVTHPLIIIIIIIIIVISAAFPCMQSWEFTAFQSTSVMN